MRHTYHKTITCIDAIKCSNQIVKKLEQLTSLRLIKTDNNKPQGSVSILHKSGNHQLFIDLYDNNNFTTTQLEYNT